jgi:hypothetical protein
MKRFIAAAAFAAAQWQPAYPQGDPRVDPGGVSGRLVLAGKHQGRGDLQARRVQAQKLAR